MNIKKLIVCIFLAAVLITGGCAKKSSAFAPEAYGTFKFSVLKIGKADATIMQTQNHCIVIDCGEKDDGKKILDFLAQSDIKKIDCLLITHFDKDHVGGAAKVIDGVAVDKIITPDYIGSNDEYRDFISAAKERGITPYAVTENESFVFDDVLFNIYPPQKTAYKTGDNDFSLVTDITHGKNRFLFAGDAEDERTAEILDTIKGKYDFLKVPHHGRYNSSTEGLIKAVSPEYSVITDSGKNPADAETLNVLNKYKSKVYSVKDGTVSVSSDGTTINITQDEN